MKDVLRIKDGMPKLDAAIVALLKDHVLVGIPEDKTDRKAMPDEKVPMTNAALGYIHEHGAPEVNIPPRPFLAPGIRENRDKITGRLKKAAKAAFSGDVSQVEAAMHETGLVAARGVKAKINDGPFAALSPVTIALRNRSRSTKSQRKSELAYLEMVGQGMTPEDAQEAAGIHPLINTGQLRNSINYVLVTK